MAGPEMVEAKTVSPVAATERGGRNRLATAVIGGHAIKHLYLSAMQSILLPEIKIAFGLTGAQLGTLATMRQVSGWGSTMGAGYLGDRFSSKTGLMLAISLGLMGAAYALAGMSTSYGLLLVALFLAGIGPSLYHPPAIGALSRSFPDRRAFAISLHGTGGSIGEVLGPIVAAGLLVFLTWRGVLQLSLLPALLAAFVIWHMLGSTPLQDGVSGSFRDYLRALARLLHNKALGLLVLVTALRSMGQSSVMIFLPVYLREDLGYEAVTVGVFLSLAQLAGVGSQPVMGFLSDRIGHKSVLVPAMIALSLLFAALAFMEGTFQLAVVIVALGAFLYSLHSIFISAAIGAAGEETQATTVSVIYGASFLGTLSPILAGFLADAYGTQSVFLYAAVLVIVATVILASMRLPAPVRITQS